MHRQQSLVSLLLELFTVEEMRDFTASLDRSLAQELPEGTASAANVAAAVVAGLDARGFLDRSFFDRLADVAVGEEERLVDVACAFGIADMSIADASVLPNIPYKGIDAYTPDDAHIFFGREAQIREWSRRLLATDTPPVVLIHGPSGVGKSSFLRAGLEARLRRLCRVHYRRRTLGGLSAAIATCFEGADPEPAWRARESRGEAVVVLLDQVEEALLGADSNDTNSELQGLFDRLLPLLRGTGRLRHGRLVLAFRSEWLGRIYDLVRVKNDVECDVCLIRSLDRDGILRVLEGPTRRGRLASKYRFSWQAGLTERITNDLLADEKSPIAPTLQLLVQELHGARAVDRGADGVERGEIRTAQYTRLRHEQLFRAIISRRLEAMQQRPELAEANEKGLLLELLHVCTTKLGTARTLSLQEFHTAFPCCPTTLRLAVHAFEGERLLLLEDNGIRLAHDTLAAVVQQLHAQSPRVGPRAYRLLTRRLDEAADGGEVAYLSARDLALLHAGEPWRRVYSAEEAVLVRRSRVALVRRRLYMLLALAASLAIALAGWRWVAGYRPLYELDQARRALTRATAALESGDRPLAAALALAAHTWSVARGQPQERAAIDEVLRDALRVPLSRSELGLTSGQPQSLAWSSRDGRLLVAASTRAWVWHHPSNGPQTPVETTSAIRVVRISPEGQTVVAGTINGELYLFSAGDLGAPPDLLGKLGGGVLALDVDARWIVGGGADGRVLRWSRTRRSEPVMLTAHAGAVNSVALGAQDVVASVAETGEVVVAADPHRRIFRRVHDTPLNAVVHTGEGFVYAGESGALLTFPAETDEPVLGTLAGDPVEALASTGGRVFSAHRSGTVAAWSRRPGRWTLADRFSAHTGPARSVVASGDSVFTAGTDGRVRQWSIAPPPARVAAETLAAHAPLKLLRGIALPRQDAICAIDDAGDAHGWDYDGMQPLRPEDLDGCMGHLGVSRDGRWTADVAEHGLEVRDAEDGTVRSVELGLQGTPNAAAVDDRGEWAVLSSDAPGEAVLVDVGRGRTHRIPLPPREGIGAVAITADGSSLAVAGRSTHPRVRIFDRTALDAPAVEIGDIQERIVALAFTLDGRALLAASASGVMARLPLTATLAEQACDYIGGSLDDLDLERVHAELHLPPTSCMTPRRTWQVHTRDREDADEPLFYGCREVRAERSCVVIPGDALRVWMPDRAQAQPALLLNERPTAATTVRVDHGVRYNLEITAAPAVLNARWPDGSTWTLRLVQPDPEPALDREVARLPDSPDAANLGHAADRLRRLASDHTGRTRARLLLKAAEYRSNIRPPRADICEEEHRDILASLDDALAGGLRSAVADRAFVLIQRLMSDMNAPAEALDRLDELTQWFDGSSESEADRAFIRGALLRKISGHLRFEAEQELRRAYRIARRIGYAGIYTRAATELLQLLLLRFEHVEGAEQLEHELLMETHTGSPCERGRLANNLGWMVLEARLSGRPLGDPRPALERARRLYAEAPAAAPCEAATIDHNLANLAAEACLRGALTEASGYLEAIDVEHTSEIDDFLDKFVLSTRCLGSGGSFRVSSGS
jgi:hypothetical protein